MVKSKVGVTAKKTTLSVAFFFFFFWSEYSLCSIHRGIKHNYKEKQTLGIKYRLYDLLS